MSRDVRTTMSVIEEQIGPFNGKRVLDLGCGHGSLARALAKRGARVTGVDPQEEAIAAARAAVPDGDFLQAGAERLPHEDGAFDAVVILNALHHVPAGLMGPALREAARVSAGPLLVIEPLAEGSFFVAMQPVDDETQIRAEAQDAIAEAVEAGALKLLATIEYDGRLKFPSSEAFLKMVLEADPARAPIVQREKARVAEIFHAVSEPGDEGFTLTQPHRAHLLQRAA